MEALNAEYGKALDPVSAAFAPQVWGEYENGGLRLEIQPKVAPQVTVEAPADDEGGVLFSVFETASREADGTDGAGWLLSIGKVDEARTHEMLCGDMSGTELFAKDGDGQHYVSYFPTDVRYTRASTEQMQQDPKIWSALCGWADRAYERFAKINGLEAVSFGNSPVDFSLARAAWAEGVNATLSTAEYGPLAVEGTDGTPYAEFLIKNRFLTADSSEKPDGESVELAFPDEDLRLDFYFAPGGYVSVMSGEEEMQYQTLSPDEPVSVADAMLGRYYDAAELAGVREADTALDAFPGVWAEKAAGRGMLTVEKSLAPGKIRLTLIWPQNADELCRWELLASLGRDRLAYEDGVKYRTETDEDGDEWTVEESSSESGFFYLNGDGELCWHDESAGSGEDSAFVRAD